MRVEIKEDFIVECNVCRLQYENHVGSTPCCGSIAFDVKGNIHVYSKEVDETNKDKKDE